jgi:hypothetical protein
MLDFFLIEEEHVDSAWETLRWDKEISELDFWLSLHVLKYVIKLTIVAFDFSVSEEVSNCVISVVVSGKLSMTTNCNINYNFRLTIDNFKALVHS